MENQEKINTTAYVKVLDIFLDRLTVKRIIPIPYKNAVNEVLYDMDSMFDDEENRKAFRGVIDNFTEQTNLEGWYEGEYDNR